MAFFLLNSPTVNTPALPFADTDAVDISGQLEQPETVSSSPTSLLPSADSVEQFNSFTSQPTQSVSSPSHEQSDTIEEVTVKDTKVILFSQAVFGDPPQCCSWRHRILSEAEKGMASITGGSPNCCEGAIVKGEGSSVVFSGQASRSGAAQ